MEKHIRDISPTLTAEESSVFLYRVSLPSEPFSDPSEGFPFSSVILVAIAKNQVDSWTMVSHKLNSFPPSPPSCLYVCTHTHTREKQGHFSGETG